MIQAVVTDIEGTTSSLSFVHDVLFPYARKHLAGYVHAHKHEAEVRKLLDDANREAGGDLDDDGVVTRLIAWIDADRKVTALKSLQGLIWEHGYRAGDFKGHVYPDAYENLKRWHQRGWRLYVYSSGSVYAQKLLFGHTDYGDLTPLFSGYFDTRTGAKRDPGSYSTIAQAVAAPAGEIVFLSDVVEELDAAAQAGLRTFWLVRDGTPRRDAAHPQVRDFDGVDAWLARRA